ncbi:hypothetical protein [Aeromicrobium alkaliterrae]|uniref:Glycosyltransferase n=1 Tax=Aeromicrobium alkaliterrae TaxID=302168 RepID=A0ABN2K3L7_9ACTN
MKSASITTLVVDPDYAGHHMQSVSWVTQEAVRWGPVVLLTGRGAADDPAFREYLGDDVAAGRVEVHEVFDTNNPPTTELVEQVVTRARATDPSTPVGLVLHMDGDQALKRWWLVARGPLRTLAVRPRVHFMLTRYPARVPLGDLTGWKLKIPKAILSVAGRLTGTLHRVVGYVGRDDTARGWIVKRVQDPEFCAAHSRDRDQWRAEYGLPADRRIAGIFGVIYERKNAPMLLEALEQAGVDADLLLAGKLSDGVRDWVEALPPASRERVIVRDEYLTNEVLDRLVAAVDVVPLALTNNGPSGIMGKAEAAGVAVVTAGSKVRAREVRFTGGGVACDLTVPALGEAMRAVLAGEVEIRTGRNEQWAAVEEYCRRLLDVRADGVPHPAAALAARQD